MYAYPATGNSQTMLERIVSLLFALADLAEQASGRCFAIRVLVLLILRPAEAAARRFVMDFYADTDIAPLLQMQDDDDSTAAIRLALSFRALAMALAALPEWVLEVADCLQAIDQWLRPVAACLGNLHEICEAPRHALAPARLDSS